MLPLIPGINPRTWTPFTFCDSPSRVSPLEKGGRGCQCCLPFMFHILLPLKPLWSRWGAVWLPCVIVSRGKRRVFSHWLLQDLGSKERPRGQLLLRIPEESVSSSFILEWLASKRGCLHLLTIWWMLQQTLGPFSSLTMKGVLCGAEEAAETLGIPGVSFVCSGDDW